MCLVHMPELLDCSRLPRARRQSRGVFEHSMMQQVLFVGCLPCSSSIAEAWQCGAQCQYTSLLWKRTLQLTLSAGSWHPLYQTMALTRHYIV